MSEEIAPKTIQLFGILEKALNYIRKIESPEITPIGRYCNAEFLNNEIKQLPSIEIFQDILIDELELSIGKDAMRFNNIKRKYDKALNYRIYNEIKDKILKSPIDSDTLQYIDPKTGEITTGYLDTSLTIELIHENYKNWIEFSIDKIILFQETLEEIINDYESKYFDTDKTIQVFKTNLSDDTLSPTFKPKIPPKPFTDYLKGVDIALLMILLHEILDNAKAKDFAKFIIALKDLQYLYIPNPRTSLYSAIRNEFGDIGTDSGMNSYLRENIEPKSNTKILYSEIEETKGLITNHLKT